jgi:hypothetical protein
VAPRDPDRRCELLGRARPAHRERAPFGDSRITGVQRELERLGARAFVAEHGAKVIHERLNVRDEADATD